MDATTALEFQWPYLLRLIGPLDEINQSARDYKAFSRARGIRSPSDLLRMCLAYANCSMSLRTAAAWADAADVAVLSDVALLKRLRGSQAWLAHLLARMLDARRADLASRDVPWRLRLIDATCVSEPGSTGTNWRIHLSWDLRSATIDSVEVTDGKVGESLKRFAFQPGDLVIADRAYGVRPGLAHVVAQGGDFIVRAPWKTLPLTDRDDQPFDLLENLETVGEATCKEFAVRLAATAGIEATDVRLVAVRKTEEAAAASRNRILKDAARKQRQTDLRTLAAAGFFFVITSLPAHVATPEHVLELYRLRWQVELQFKRLKSLLDLDLLPAKEPKLAKVWLYSHLIGALLLDRYREAHLDFSPWGYRIPPTLAVADGPDAERRDPCGDRADAERDSPCGHPPDASSPFL